MLKKTQPPYATNPNPERSTFCFLLLLMLPLIWGIIPGALLPRRGTPEPGQQHPRAELLHTPHLPGRWSAEHGGTARGQEKALFAKKILTIYINLHPNLYTLCIVYIQIVSWIKMSKHKTASGYLCAARTGNGLGAGRLFPQPLSHYAFIGEVEERLPPTPGRDAGRHQGGIGLVNGCSNQTAAPGQGTASGPWAREMEQTRAACPEEAQLAAGGWL